MDVDRQNLLGRVRGDFLDVHAARRRRDERDASALAVERERKIDFALDFGARFHIDLFDRQALLTRLLRDEARAQHAFGGSADRPGVPSELHASGLAAATRVHLCLDHPNRTADRLRRSSRFIGACGYASRRNSDPVASEEILSLILMQIHRHRRTRKASILPKIALRDQQWTRLG